MPFPATPPSEDAKIEPFETKEALNHFRILLKFVDKYFAKQLKLYNRLKEGLEDKIAYENLWMLFNPGNDIYCPSLEGGLLFKNSDGSEEHVTKPRYTPQLFRVLGASGGLPLVKSLAPNQKVEDGFKSPQPPEAKGELGHGGMSSDLDRAPVLSPQRNRNRFAHFSVVCFNIDFDGFEYGTVRERFLFKPHDGLVDIRNLEVYPVQYLKSHLTRPLPGNDAPEPDPLRYFLDRGNNFIKATKVSHLSYEGLSVGKSREEVSTRLTSSIPQNR